MTALAPAFHSVDHIVGLNLNRRKRCWVQYGSEGRESLLLLAIRHVRIFAKCRLSDNHDWTGWPHSSLDGTPEKFIQRVLKINASTKSLVERLCDLKIYAVSVLSYIGSICASDKATLKAEAHTCGVTAGPYNALPTSLLGVGSVCGLGPVIVGIHSISLAVRYRTAACSTRSTKDLRRSRLPERLILHLFLHSAPIGKRHSSCSLHGLYYGGSTQYCLSSGPQWQT